MNIYSPSNRIYIYLLNIFPNAQEIDIDVTNKKCWRWQDTEYVRPGARDRSSYKRHKKPYIHTYTQTTISTVDCPDLKRNFLSHCSALAEHSITQCPSREAAETKL